MLTTKPPRCVLMIVPPNVVFNQVRNGLEKYFSFFTMKRTKCVVRRNYNVSRLEKKLVSVLEQYKSRVFWMKSCLGGQEYLGTPGSSACFVVNEVTGSSAYFVVSEVIGFKQS